MAGEGSVIGSIVAKLKLNIDDFTSNMKRAEETLRDVDKQFEGVSKIGDRMKDVGSSLTTHLTMPLVGIGAVATKFFMDFEEGMAKVSTVADTTQVPIDDLKQGVIDLSNQSGLSTDDIASGLYDVLSAGVSTSDSMDYLGVAVKSARGGFTDTATAVDGLTSTLNAYGMESSKAIDIANEMMVAQNLGKTTFGEMASVMGNVAPTANALGVSTKELFSSLAVLTANGIKTTEAVTGLKATYSNIIKPSKEASDAAKSLGIEFDASTIKTKGFMPFLQGVKDKLSNVAPEYLKAVEHNKNLAMQMEALEKAGKKGSEQYKDLNKQYKESNKDLEVLEVANKGTLSGFAKMFGSVEALNTVLTLTSEQGMTLYDQSMTQMGDGTDRVSQAYETMGGTTKVTMEKAMQSLKNSTLGLGEALAPAIEKVAGFISTIADALGKLSPAQANALIGVGGFLAVLGPGVSIVGGFVDNIGKVSSAFTKANKLIKEFEIAQKLSAVATKIATVAQGAFNAVMLVNPIVWIVGLIMLLVGGLVLLYNKNEWFRNGVNACWEAIKNYLSGFFTWAGAKISEFGTALTNGWNSIKAGAEAMWNGFVSFFKNLWTGIVNFITGVLLSIKNFFVNTWSGIVNAVLGLVNTFKTNVTNAFATTFVFIQAHIQNFKNIFIAVWNLIKTVVLGIVLIFLDLITGNFTKLKEDVVKLMNLLGNQVKAVWNAIKEFFVFLWKTLSADFKNIWDNIKTNLFNTWNGIKDGAKNTWNNLKESVINTVKALGNSIQATWQALKTWFFTTCNNIKNDAVNAFNNLKTAVHNAVINTKNNIVNAWNGILAFFSSLPSRLYNAGVSMFNSMRNGIQATISGIRSTIVNGINNAVTFITSLPAKARVWGADFIDGMVGGIKASIGKIIGAVSGVADKIRSFLHFSVPDEGPLTDYETWMPDFVDGMTKGIEKNKFKLSDAVKGMAKDVSGSMEVRGSIQDKVQVSPAKALAGASGDKQPQNITTGGVQIQNLYVRNDRDIAKISQAMYNENDKVIRALGKI